MLWCPPGVKLFRYYFMTITNHRVNIGCAGCREEAPSQMPLSAHDWDKTVLGWHRHCLSMGVPCVFGVKYSVPSRAGYSTRTVPWCPRIAFE